MAIQINTTEAPDGSIEHYRHYRAERERLHGLLSTTPIRERSHLTFLLDGVMAILEEYEDLT